MVQALSLMSTFRFGFAASVTCWTGRLVHEPQTSSLPKYVPKRCMTRPSPSSQTTQTARECLQQPQQILCRAQRVTPHTPYAVFHQSCGEENVMLLLVSKVQARGGWLPRCSYNGHLQVRGERSPNSSASLRCSPHRSPPPHNRSSCENFFLSCGRNPGSACNGFVGTGPGDPTCTGAAPPANTAANAWVVSLLALASTVTVLVFNPL